MNIQLRGWQDLPQDIYQEICSNLKPYERTVTAQVCTGWTARHVTLVRNSLCDVLEETVVKILQRTAGELLYGITPANQLQDEQLEEAIRLPVVLFSHEKRTERQAKRAWNALVRSIDACQAHCSTSEAEIPKSSLDALRDHFTALACSLPSFENVRTATTLGQIRSSFLKAVKSLDKTAEHNFDRPKKETAVVKDLIETVLEYGQDYVLHDLIPSIQKAWTTDIEGSFETSRTPWLLQDNLSSAGWMINACIDCLGLAKELITCKEFEETDALSLIDKYDLLFFAKSSVHAIEVLLDALIKQERIDEAARIYLNPITRFFVFSSNKQLLQVLYALMSSNRADVAMQIFRIYFQDAQRRGSPYPQSIYIEPGERANLTRRLRDIDRLEEALEIARTIPENPQKELLLWSIAERAVELRNLPLALRVSHASKSQYSLITRVAAEALDAVQLLFNRLW